MGLLDQLQSFGQGASNSAASTVTAPVDGLAWLLRKMGVPVPSDPVGGSDWAAKQGLTATPKNHIAGLLGEAFGGVAPMVAAAKAPQIAKGLLQAEANAMAPRTLNPQTGAIVWHGSPHKFDKFDSSKIGTGEGAQAYGHGLYLAESPDVAGTYAANLTTNPVRINGKAAETVLSDLNAQRFMRDANGDLELAKQIAQKEWQHFKKVEPSATMRGYVEDAQKQLNAIDAKSVTIERPGSLYKVDLPDDQIAKMLDWDKPLSQQPQAFKDAVSAREQQRMMPILEQRRATLAGLPQGAENASILKKQIAILEDEITQPQAVPNMTGGEYFNYLRNREMAPAEQADWLRKAGIPGIRYLDGGSRGAGQGSSNFVVFPGNEGLLSILERNGQQMP